MLGQKQILRVRQVASQAVRRAMGFDGDRMQELHVTDRELHSASGWDDIETAIRKHCLQWLGHVARMPTRRLPKKVLFGWISCNLGKQSGVEMVQPRLLLDTLGERASRP